MLLLHENECGLERNDCNRLPKRGIDYNVSLILREEDRSKVVDLEKIFVPGTSGRVALANFASLSQGLGPVNIRRENQNRIIHITTNILSGEKAYIVERIIEDEINANLLIPDSVSISYEGSWKAVSDTGRPLA